MPSRTFPSQHIERFQVLPTRFSIPVAVYGCQASADASSNPDVMSVTVNVCPFHFAKNACPVLLFDESLLIAELIAASVLLSS